LGGGRLSARRVTVSGVWREGLKEAEDRVACDVGPLTTGGSGLLGHHDNFGAQHLSDPFGLDPHEVRLARLTGYARAVITGAHVMVFTRDAEGLRGFLAGTLGLSSVDAGPGWPIFALPAAELAAHPSEKPHHEIYLMCDDIDATVSELKTKGVEFTRPITETDWGRMTAFQVPGGDELAIYEPTHPTPLGATR
jgi:uncharacterized glyoxalase superfamily protein PhnB